jgi:hypothetical protein
MSINGGDEVMQAREAVHGHRPDPDAEPFGSRMDVKFCLIGCTCAPCQSIVNFSYNTIRRRHLSSSASSSTSVKVGSEVVSDKPTSDNFIIGFGALPLTSWHARFGIWAPHSESTELESICVA